MKFLILGSNGMVGHMVGFYLNENGHKVVGFARTKSNYVQTLVGDVTDKKYIKEIITEGEFDVIVNCIGILTNESEQKKAEAAYINGYIPHFLADLTKNLRTKIIQISTDCVFSGKRGGYREYDLRDGVSFYDRSKALGELDDMKNVTIRCSVVGPDLKENGSGLLNWFMCQSDEVNGYTNVFWTGQTTLQLAKTIEAIAVKDIFGIHNLVPNRKISKFDLLSLFNKYLRKNHIAIVPKDDIVLDKSLIRTRTDFDFRIPDYECMISELADIIYAHRQMYPHYELK